MKPSSAFCQDLIIGHSRILDTPLHCNGSVQFISLILLFVINMHIMSL